MYWLSFMINTKLEEVFDKMLSKTFYLKKMREQNPRSLTFGTTVIPIKPFFWTPPPFFSVI